MLSHTLSDAHPCSHRNGIDFSALTELSGLDQRTFECTSLKIIYGDSKLILENSTAYNTFTSAYWSSQQGTVQPRCVFKPSQALEVSNLVLLSRLTNCPFAVKGGGHAAFAGASNIEGGITVTMESFKQVSVSTNKKIVDIGPGNRWVDVYTALEPYGIGVPGGRMAPVGVPGLILGGGINFFANKLGWACDNIIIVTATPTSFSDLYCALRGGGSNFGIVTNFKLDAFPLGKMWGGQRIYTEANFAAVLDAVYRFATTNSSEGTDAAEIVSFSYAPTLGRIGIAQLDYAQPVANASIFNDWNAIQHLQSTTDVHTLAELNIMMNQGLTDGLRQTQWDVSFQVDRELFTFLVNTFYTELPTVQDATGFFPSISIQAITAGQLKGMQKNGGNALGLDPSNGPYFIMNMSSRWANECVKAEAQSKGLDNDYIHMN
ncbi:FAD-binding domain-containing protein [Lizonia empirigonia]|nr:FAD-binding domain-containing protein [Lizonia empirigonia]